MPAQVIPKAAHLNWPTIPGYDILQRLGEGGMGVVYKARHRGLKRLVAVKMIRGGSQARADHLSRFRVEAEAVARLRHPHIIQIYDIGEAAGLPFVALELLDGGGLDDRLDGTPQPGNQSAELMVTLARAVHVAHQAGIVHRDLKPTNVLYTSDGVPQDHRLRPGQADRLRRWADRRERSDHGLASSYGGLPLEQVRRFAERQVAGRRLRALGATSFTRCSPPADHLSRGKPRWRQSARSSWTTTR